MPSVLRKRFENDGRPTVRLSSSQQQAIKEFKSRAAPKVRTETCMICGGKDFDCLAQKDRYGLPLDVVICRTCGYVFANPYYCEAFLPEFYEHWSPRIYRNYTGQDEEELHQKFRQNHRKGKLIYDFISLNWREIHDKTVVEIGVGAGGILSYFREQGNQVYGTDFANAYLEYGKTMGLTLFEGGIEQISSHGIRPHLIIYADVLEHIPAAKDELEKVYSLLPENGCIFIKLPSIKNLEPYRRNFLRQLQNAHIHYFSLRTLNNLMTQCGFKLVKGNESIMAIFKKGRPVQSYESDYSEVMRYLTAMESSRLSLRYRLRIIYKMLRRLLSPLKYSFSLRRHGDEVKIE